MRHGLDEYEILPRYAAWLRGQESAPAGRTRVTFDSIGAAERFLRELRSDPAAGTGGQLARLRALIFGEPTGAGVGSFSLERDETLRRGALMLLHGQLVVLRRDRPIRSAGSTGSRPEPRPELPEPVVRARHESLRIVTVLERSWQPVAGVTLAITAPDGVPTATTTGRDGAAELERLQPGSCRVSAELEGATLATCFEVAGLDPGRPPEPGGDGEAPELLAGRRHVVSLRRHRVAGGETLASVAEEYGTTWQRLARFNFGTADPREVNRALRNQVGCRRRSANGANYVFTDDDDPGLLFVPEAWDQGGLRTDQTYTLRLQIPRITPIRRFVFSM